MAITDIKLSGKVFTDAGTAVNGATVALLETGTSTVETSGTTNSSGEWSFTETDLDTTYDIKITVGSSVRYILWSDEITTTGLDTASLKVRGVEGAVAPIYLFADQADDAGDAWRIQASASDTLAIGSDKASAGTIIDYLTITNGANAAASVIAAGGDLTVGDDLSLTSDSSVINMGAGNDFTITHDGTTGATLAGNPLTLDSGADIVLDAEGADVILKDGGTQYGALTNSSSNLIIKSGSTTAATFSGANVTFAGTVDATTDFTIGSTVITDDVITFTPSSSDTVTLTSSANGAFSLVTVDNAAAAANIQITADGTAELAGTTVTLDSAADIELEATNDINVPASVGLTFGDDGEKIEGDGSNLVVESSGTLDMNSGGVLTLDSGAAINIEPAGGSAILLDGTISIDAGVVTGATSITSTAFVGTLDGVIGGNTPAAITGTTGTFSGVLGVADGSVSAPSIANTGDANTGFFWGADEKIDIAIGGQLWYRFASGGMGIGEAAILGSPGAPRGLLELATDGSTYGSQLYLTSANNQVASGDALGGIEFVEADQNMGGSDDGKIAAAIRFVATETGTNSANGVKLDFYTTLNGATTPTKGMTLGNDSALTLTGTTNATSGSTGSINTLGGLGVTGDIWCEGTVRARKAASGGNTIVQSHNESSDANSHAMVSASATSTSGDAIMAWGNAATDWAAGNDNSNSDAWVIGPHGSLGGNDALRITTATPPIITFNATQGSDFDYVCEVCGASRAEPFVCHDQTAPWHDDVLALMPVLAATGSGKKLTGLEPGVKHLAKLGVLDISTNNDGSPWIGLNAVSAQWYAYSGIVQTRRLIDAQYAEIDKRLKLAGV